MTINRDDDDEESRRRRQGANIKGFNSTEQDQNEICQNNWQKTCLPHHWIPTKMPQGCGHVRSWRYTIYGSPPARDHRGYVVVLPKQIPRPHEDLKRIENTLYQFFWDACPEEGESLNLLGVWSLTKEGDNHIHLLYAATTRAERAETRGLGKLRQIQTSWYQGGKGRCCMGMVLL